MPRENVCHEEGRCHIGYINVIRADAHSEGKMEIGILSLQGPVTVNGDRLNTFQNSIKHGRGISFLRIRPIVMSSLALLRLFDCENAGYTRN